MSYQCVCGREFETIKSRGCHRAHCKKYQEQRAKLIRDRKFCMNCGKELTESQILKGNRYCSHRCYSISEEGHGLFERSLALNRFNPYFNYKQFNRYTISETGFLYFIKIGNNLKIGSTQNIFKRLNELSGYDPDITPIRVLFSDSLLVSYAETLILNNFDHTNEFMDYSDELVTRITNIFDNLMAWLSLNNYTNEYPELLGDHTIKVVSIDRNYKELYPKLFGGTLSKWNSSINIDKLEFSDDRVEFSTTFDDPDRLLTLSNGLITHNCRLRLDLRELIKVGGGLFGSGDKTGSIGVVTLNLSKIAYISKVYTDDCRLDNDYRRADQILSNYPALRSRLRVLVSTSSDTSLEIGKRAFFIMIKYFMDLARQSLMIKRDRVQDSLDRGLIPYTKKYLGSFRNHFNTIGVNAGHEACLNLLGKGIDSEEGQSFMKDTLKYMLKVLADYQEEDNGQLLWNLEAVPAEGASTRFAKRDKKDFEHIITGAGTGGTFYTNSTQLPDNYTDNIFEVFKHQNELQPLYTSGTVQHIYMNEPTHNWRVIQSLVRTLFTNYKLPYLSISPDICVCPVHGKLPHNYDHCPYEHSEEDIKKLLEEGVISEDDIVEID